MQNAELMTESEDLNLEGGTATEQPEVSGSTGTVPMMRLADDMIPSLAPSLFTVSHVISPIPNSRIVPGTDSMAPSPSRRNIEVKTTDDP